MMAKHSESMLCRCHTTIPVPEVHAFNAHVNNEVGAPYMLLTYIHGTIADEIEGIESATDVEGTRHVLDQLAKIMVELATCKFDRIGSIFANVNGNFEIGPLLETDEGPYSTAQEYYQAISDHRFRIYAGCFANNEEARRAGGLHLPLLFNNLMPIFTNSRVDKGSFSLTNTDFGPHNVLVDEQLNVVGLIDCDNVFAAPIHVVAKIPSAGCMSSGLPGLKPRRLIAQQVIAEGQFWREQFVPMVAAAEKSFDAGTPIADAMTSDAAWLVEGLENYQHHQSTRLVDWVNCYWYLYYRHTLGKASYCLPMFAAANANAGPSAAVEFTDANMRVEIEGDEEDEEEEEQVEEEDEETRAEDGVVEVLDDLSEDGKVCKEESTDEVVERHLESLVQEYLIEDEEVCRGETAYQGLEKRLENEVIMSNQVESSEEEVPTENEAEQEGPRAGSSESVVAELMKLLKRELIAEVKAGIAADIKQDLMEDLKKAVKEELKQQHKFELTTELRDARKDAHNNRDMKTSGVEAEKIDGDTIREDRVEEQESDKEKVGHEVPNGEKGKEGVAKEEPRHGVQVGQEVDKEGVADNEEQGASAGDAERCSIMGP